VGLRGERCASQVTAGRSERRRKSASIWFHPEPPAADWPGGNGGGSTDFLALFQADAPWPNAIAHVSVIGMYAGWITAASDEDLQQTVAFLNAHNMGVEIEAPALQATATRGSGVEGYVPFGLSLHDFTLAYLDRLKALGSSACRRATRPRSPACSTPTSARSIEDPDRGAATARRTASRLRLRTLTPDGRRYR
jgi:hypothetical protein